MTMKDLLAAVVAHPPILTMLWVSLWLKASTIGAALRRWRRGFTSWRLRRRSRLLARSAAEPYSLSFERRLQQPPLSSPPCFPLSKSWGS